jgi:transposase
VPSSRRLERECQRNLELIWLTGGLAPDFKTIADFRKDNGEAIGKVCREFVALCRRLQLLNSASVAIDGSKFKAVNARDKNFTEAKMQRRLEGNYVNFMAYRDLPLRFELAIVLIVL